MASFTPYTYIQCPCTGSSIASHPFGAEGPNPESENDEDERTFDPRAPRANYSLYPLEHLLYCEDCHEIRCPRCVLDEIVTWYCPNCLFEVPSSTVRSEGTRCTRSCFQCPICIAPLSVSSVEAPPEGLGAEYATMSGPYVLNCSYCNWSSREIGIVLEKANSVFHQLSKMRNKGQPGPSTKEVRKESAGRALDVSTPVIVEESAEAETDGAVLNADTQFANLKAFYQTQLMESSPTGALGLTGEYAYGSPGALSRIMGLYTGVSFSDKKSKSRPGIMREAFDASEGLKVSSPSSEKAILRLRDEGWHSTASSLQMAEQLHDVKFVSDLWPVAYMLRTKRSKRCKSCRHILSKPESKISTTKFRIRLVALNYIPTISIKPLQPHSSSKPTGLLTPLKPTQYVLTFKNPLFDGVKVSIATPTITPGRFPSGVTVLCPQFEVGANTDVWDEALRESGGGKGGEREKRRTKEEASEGQPQAEAGKVWERGRNWVSVVVEVVPASLRIEGPAFLRSEAQQKDDGPLKEDEDILEIPIFVRVEWETVVQDESAGLAAKEKEVKEKRELAYWCVLGVGRIAQI